MIAKLAALVACFLAVLWQVQSGGPLVMLDGRVNSALGPLRTRFSLAGFAWLTQIGTGAAGTIIALVASGLFWSDGRRRLILPIWLAFLGAQATTWSLKFVTDRARPPFLEGVTAGSPSFPSAHATVSTAIYGFVGLAIAQGVDAEARGAVYAATIVLVLSIMFSRIFLSLHYLSDVLAGACVGGAWLVLAWQLARGT